MQKINSVFHFSRENTQKTLICIFQLDTITRISYLHDRSYKSVNFGEDLIKEMLFSSVCRIPLSAKSTMTAYRLMIQRVININLLSTAVCLHKVFSWNHFHENFQEIDFTKKSVILVCLLFFSVYRYTKWPLLLIHSVN